ncbi:MAG: ABC transporter ATP-binding protein [Actinomycetota bacterium]
MTGGASGGIAISVTGVSVDYRARRALDTVDVAVEPGEWLALIGPNGAGKSSLLRAIAGLVPAATGTIAIGDGRAPAARDIALVPQVPVMPPGMTVAEYVLLGRTAHLAWLARESAHDRDVVHRTLAELALDGFADRPVDELSGGEAQRVVLARALAQQTPALLLDEPTSALDLGHQLAVLDAIDEQRRRIGLTVVAAMHDLTVAARYATRMVLLAEGRVVATGLPAEVLEVDVLNAVYATALSVRVLDDEIVVLPAARHSALNHITSDHDELPPTDGAG